MRGLRPVRVWLCFALFSMLLFGNGLATGSETTVLSERKKILILHSYRQGYEWTDEIHRGLIAGLDNEAVDFHIEYLDTQRHFDDTCASLLEALLRHRFSSANPIDAIFCSDDPALDFLLSRRLRLFQKVPLVFCGANSFDPSRLAGIENVAGVNEKISIGETVDAIRKLRPSMKTLAVVSDATQTGMRNKQLFYRIDGAKIAGLNVLNLEAPEPEQLAAELAKLTIDDAVLYLSYLKTAAGKNIALTDSTLLVASASAAPVFGCWDFLLGNGILGGKLVNGFDQGYEAAQLLKAIFAGQSVDNLNKLIESPNRFIFDYHVMQRFNILADELPAGALIRNFPGPGWKAYWQWFVLALLFIIIETLLILRLLKSRRYLKFGEARHQAMLANTGDVIAIIDKDGINQYKSANVEKLFGWKPSQLIGFETWLNVHPEDLESTQKVFASLAEGKLKEATSTCRYKCADGSYKWIEYTAANLSDNELIGGVLLNYHDVTERIEAAEAQRDLERQVQQAQRLESLGVLAGGIAHDFNNILTAIQGYVEISLADIPKSSSVHKHLLEVMRASRRAADLCQQMLAYSGRGNFMIENVNLSRLTQEIAGLLKASISKKAILKVEKTGREPIINGDVTQINQIIMNMVINASDAIGNQEGSIIIATGSLDMPAGQLSHSLIPTNMEPGEVAFVKVSDTGCGMTEDVKKRLFEPFFTTKFTGRGLGMSAVMGIVKSHGGALFVNSEPGKGSEFTIVFPLLRLTGKEEAIQPEIVTRDEYSGFTVLIVDDEESVRTVVKRILELMGFKTIIAEDGLDGVEKFSEFMNEIDVIFLDLTMPRKDGYEALTEFKKMKPDVRVIIASGYGEFELQKRFESDEKLGFIQKPYSIQLIKQQLQKIFAKNGQE